MRGRLSIFGSQKSVLKEIYGKVFTDDNVIYERRLNENLESFFSFFSLGFVRSDNFVLIMNRPGKDYDMALFYRNLYAKNNKLNNLYIFMEELEKGNHLISGYEFQFLEDVIKKFNDFNQVDELLKNTDILKKEKDKMSYRKIGQANDSKLYFYSFDKYSASPLFVKTYHNGKSEKLIPSIGFDDDWKDIGLNKEFYLDVLGTFLIFINDFKEFSYSPQLIAYDKRIMLFDSVHVENDRDILLSLIIENSPSGAFGFEELMFDDIANLFIENKSIIDFDNIYNRSVFKDSDGYKTIESQLNSIFSSYLSCYIGS